MALIELKWKSQVLGVATETWLILPELSEGTAEADLSPEHGFPVLYLLHGLSDDHTTFMRRTSLERHVGPHGLVVVLPQAGRSFYADQKQGYPFFTYVNEEIPALLGRSFRVSTRREDTFVAGFSMGGYGAFLLALRQPERFGAAISFSGVLDIRERIQSAQGEDARKDDDFYRAFGESAEFEGSAYDLVHMLEKQKAAGVDFPKLYAVCGEEDFLLASNRSFQRAVEETGVAWTYEEVPGAHTWEFVDRELPRALDWLAKVRGRC